MKVQWLRPYTSTAGATGSIAGLGTKIPHALWPGQKTKHKTKQVIVSKILCKCDFRSNSKYLQSSYFLFIR